MKRFVIEKPTKRPTDNKKEDPRTTDNLSELPNIPPKQTKGSTFFTLSDGLTINADRIDLIEPEETKGERIVHVGDQQIALQVNEVNQLLNFISNK